MKKFDDYIIEKEELNEAGIDYIALGQAVLASLPILGALIYNEKIGNMSDKGIEAVNKFIAKHEKKIKGLTPEIVLKAFQKMKAWNDAEWVKKS